MEKRSTCPHAGQIAEVIPNSPDACPECLALGDRWVHLRVCLVCGHVGCCDNSKNRHARAHFHATGHAIIQSFEPGEAWRYCYADDVMLPHGKPLR
jgi:uncharacterized UBP type Zn finger protein